MTGTDLVIWEPPEPKRSQLVPIKPKRKRKSRATGAKMGRPERYSDDLAEKVLLLLEEGNTITAITQMPDMPAWDTIRKWKREHPDFLARYTRAYEDSDEAFEAWIIDRVKNVQTVDDALIARVQSHAMMGILMRRHKRKHGNGPAAVAAEQKATVVSGGLPEMPGEFAPMPDPSASDPDGAP